MNLMHAATTTALLFYGAIALGLIYWSAESLFKAISRRKAARRAKFDSTERLKESGMLS